MLTAEARVTEEPDAEKPDAGIYTGAFNSVPTVQTERKSARVSYSIPNRVFLSHSFRDKEFVRRLAEDLLAAGVPVWLDEWELNVGDSLHDRIQEGIHESSYLALVVSEHSLASAWVSRELNAALAKELEARQVVVLPLLISDVALPALLKDKVYVDFRKSYAEGLKFLMRRFIPEGRAKILWLDNDPAYLEPFINGLEGGGFDVTPVRTVSAAEQLLEDNQYRVVVIDMMIPTVTDEEYCMYPPEKTDFGHSTGLAFYERVRGRLEESGATPLFLTVRIDHHIRQQLRNSGIPDHLFASKMELRMTTDFIARIKEIVSWRWLQEGDEAWKEDQIKRARQQLSAHSSEDIVAGAETLLALGTDTDRQLVAHVAIEAGKNKQLYEKLTLLLSRT